MWEGKSHEGPSHEINGKMTLVAWPEDTHASHSVRKQQCVPRLRNSLGFMYQTAILLQCQFGIVSPFVIKSCVPFLVEPKLDPDSLKENEEDKWKSSLSSGRLPPFHSNPTHFSYSTAHLPHAERLLVYKGRFISRVPLGSE